MFSIYSVCHFEALALGLINNILGVFYVSTVQVVGAFSLLTRIFGRKTMMTN